MRRMSTAQLKSLLSELQGRVEHALPHMRPIFVELNSPLPTQNRTKTHGLLSKVSFDIDHDLYEVLQHDLPESIVLRGIVWAEEIVIIDSDQKQKRREKKKTGKDKGLYGIFWNYLYKSGFHNHPDVRELITPQGAAPIDSQQAWSLLHDVWDVGGKSLSFVSPQQLRLWLDGRGVLPNNLHLAQMIDRAEEGNFGQ